MVLAKSLGVQSLVFQRDVVGLKESTFSQLELLSQFKVEELCSNSKKRKQR